MNVQQRLLSLFTRQPVVDARPGEEAGPQRRPPARAESSGEESSGGEEAGPQRRPPARAAGHPRRKLARESSGEESSEGEEAGPQRRPPARAARHPRRKLARESSGEESSGGEEAGPQRRPPARAARLDSRTREDSSRGRGPPPAPARRAGGREHTAAWVSASGQRMAAALRGVVEAPNPQNTAALTQLSVAAVQQHEVQPDALMRAVTRMMREGGLEGLARASAVKRMVSATAKVAKPA